MFVRYRGKRVVDRADRERGEEGAGQIARQGTSRFGTVQ
jgi:hypothetical protein